MYDLCPMWEMLINKYNNFVNIVAYITKPTLE